MADRRTASAAVTFREKEFVLGMLRQSTTWGENRVRPPSSTTLPRKVGETLPGMDAVRCPRMALSGHECRPPICPLLGDKRTSLIGALISANGPNRTCALIDSTSASDPKQTSRWAWRRRGSWPSCSQSFLLCGTYSLGGAFLFSAWDHAPSLVEYHTGFGPIFLALRGQHEHHHTPDHRRTSACSGRRRLLRAGTLVLG